jgi:amino acid transporter
MTDTTPAQADQIPHRRLPFWVALAVSVALVGPTLAMSGNGQGLIGTVGKSIPLVFLIGLVGVSLVGYSFVRLTRHLNHAGSAYALVGGTIGPRTGFFSGFAMLGAYWAFAIGTLALTAAFTNAFIAELQPGNDNPYQVPWLVVVVVAAAISFVLSGRDIRLLAKILLAIEGIGILAMVVLVVVIFVRGGAPSTGIDFSVFSFSGSDVSASAVISGVVAAFLSWAGFEACASLGEETDEPGRNIPRALAGTLALTGVLFVVVMFAQVIGFGTDDAGLTAFQSSGNTLGDLGSSYVGQWFSLIIIFTAIVSAFGCHMATTAASARMLYAFGRDGFGPRAPPGHLARGRRRTGGQLDLRRGRMARYGHRQRRHRHLLPVRRRRFGVPDGQLPTCGFRGGMVRRRAQIRWRAWRPRQSARADAAAAWRCGDRGGAVVQRQRRRDMVGGTTFGPLLVCARAGYRRSRFRHREARR